MSALGRYIVDAVVLEHRSPTELARVHRISRSWIYQLVQRFKKGGYASLEPRSRRPHSCTHQAADDVQAEVLRLRAEVLRLRKELVAAGYDAGPETIAHHLIGSVTKLPSVATVWRILKRNGLIVPQPHKRPKSSFIRFEAQLPNETWQLDSTPWQLADDSPVEILNFIDDKSRVALASKALVTVKSADPVHVLHSASNTFGLPASLLSDNAAVLSS
jgi:transposase